VGARGEAERERERERTSETILPPTCGKLTSATEVPTYVRAERRPLSRDRRGKCVGVSSRVVQLCRFGRCRPFECAPGRMFNYPGDEL
jgi:hypothetical protein